MVNFRELGVLRIKEGMVLGFLEVAGKNPRPSVGWSDWDAAILSVAIFPAIPSVGHKLPLVGLGLPMALLLSG